MKNAKEWFEELPDDVKERAIRNAKEDGLLGIKCESLSQAVISTFEWGKSPEDFDYWYHIHAKLRRENK